LDHFSAGAITLRLLHEAFSEFKSRFTTPLVW